MDAISSSLGGLLRMEAKELSWLVAKCRLWIVCLWEITSPRDRMIHLFHRSGQADFISWIMQRHWCLMYACLLYM
jgi:hypothetical protein